ncbi:MAG: ATP-binding protein [Anaerolineaceae bacterium]|nr:ATP-binding protein [Anaerolineaceae bacterium]
MFIGREQELQELNRRYQQKGFQMPVIYGRRRVGKTRLIQEFCKDKPNFFFSALEQNGPEQLRGFSEALLTQLPSEGSAFISSFETWEKALQYLTLRSSEKRLVLVIDEYPYLARAVKSISSLLQRMIDHEWKNSQLYLILCGSSMSFMENQVLGYQSPLYGRRTAQFHLKPLPYWDAIKFFEHWHWQEKLFGYAACGGIPQYLEYFSAHENFAMAVKREFLTSSGHLHEEPANLLKQEMHEPAMYHSILTAIANGASKQNEVATAIQKTGSEITSYLRNLISLGLISKSLPIGEENAKKTVYQLEDNLYRFWYNFVPKSLPLISLGLAEEAWKKNVQPCLNEYFGHVFEDICLQYLSNQVRLGKSSLIYTEFGKWWGTDPLKKAEVEIDLVARNEAGILVGECKWRNEKVSLNTLKSLEAKASLISAGRKPRYALFSKSGFTEDLTELNRSDLQLIPAENVAQG